MSRSTQKIITAFGIIAMILGFSFQKTEAKPNRNISLQVFYDELSYYGEWYNNPDYGYVWRPDVDRDFKPYYSNGHWVMTEFGNTWVSDYEWGWAPFHYGRWFFDRYDGWIWAPDTEWGPAWVTWRSGNGYYGWAPLAPRINININVGRRYFVPDNHWVFIPQRCIYYPSYSRFWEPRRNVYIVQRTTIINNYYTNRNVRYNTGPRADDIRRATRQDVPVYRVADNVRPGTVTVDKGTVNIYRPDVTRDDKNAAPRVVANNNGRPTRTDGNTNRAVDGSNGNTDRPTTIDRPVRTGDERITKVEPRTDGNGSNNGTVNSGRPEVNRTNPTVNNNGDTNQQRNERQEASRSYPSSTSDSRNTRPNVDRSTTTKNDTPQATNRSERPEPSRSAPSSSNSNRSNSQNGGNSSRPSRSESTPTKSVERSAPQQSSSNGSSNGNGRPSRGN